MASKSLQYDADLVSRKMCSCELVHRSVCDPGIPFGLAQIMSERSHQPSSCNAKARRHGTPIRSFGLYPDSALRRLLTLVTAACRAVSPVFP